MKHVIERRGYITVEAAVFLPIFILAVVSLLYYINVFSITENVYHSTFDEMSRLASKASVIKAAPAFTAELENRVCSENEKTDDLDITKFRYLYWDGDLDNMICLNCEYIIDLNMPLGFGHDYPSFVRAKCRGFTGLQEKGSPMSFDEMESEGTWDPVWIFPASGEKFHSSSCTYVKANAKEMVLTDDLKRKYGDCTLCDSAELPTGSLVYCFTENGTVYHRDSCRQVDRYAMEINKEEAIRKGYTSCSKCGGG